MKKLKRFLAIILAAVMVFSLGSFAAFAEGETETTTPTDTTNAANQIILEKTFKTVSVYSAPKDETFTFWVQALPIDSIVGNQFTVTDLGKSNYDETDPTKVIEQTVEEYLGWTKYIPKIFSITFSEDELRDAKGEITKQLDITNYFKDEFDWLHPSHQDEDRVEAWAVFEAPSANSSISTDRTVYIVVKYSIKALGIKDGLVIFSGTDLQAGDKSGSLHFKNYYCNEVKLTVTNAVYKENDQGIRFPLTDVAFNYELCIEEPEESVMDNFYYSKYNAEGQKEGTSYIGFYGEKVNFTLKHGEYIKLDTPQPVGTQYYVIEFGKTGYLPSVEWYDLDGILRFNEHAKIGYQGVTLAVDEDALGLIELQRIGAPESEVDFCNVISENTPPTGVIMKIWPFALIVLVVAGGLILIAVLRRKKRTY